MVDGIESPRGRGTPRWRKRDALAAACFLAFSLTLLLSLGLWWTGAWFLRTNGSPVPADILVFWVAGGMIRAGEALAIYDPARLIALCRAALGPGDGALVAWFYPPPFLFAVAPLGLLPFLPAWIAWVAVTLGGFALALRAVLGRLGIALAVGLPASFSCAMVGQNGFLTAALMAGSLHLLDRRPWVAGILLGLLTYKPHFGPLFPLVLLATRRWTVAGVAAATAIGLAIAAEASFGPGIWAAFRAGTAEQALGMVAGGAWDWRKLQSAYGIVHALGGPGWLAIAAQAAVAAIVAALLLALWLRPAPSALRAAGLAAGSLLISPYVFIYDAPVATVAIAFLLADIQTRGLRRGEALLLGLAALAPAAQFLTVATLLPPAAAILLGLALRRAWVAP